MKVQNQPKLRRVATQYTVLVPGILCVVFRLVNQNENGVKMLAMIFRLFFWAEYRPQSQCEFFPPISWGIIHEGTESADIATNENILLLDEYSKVKLF
jgi:hypothetical protein